MMWQRAWFQSRSYQVSQEALQRSRWLHWTAQWPLAGTIAIVKLGRAIEQHGRWGWVGSARAWAIAMVTALGGRTLLIWWLGETDGRWWISPGFVLLVMGMGIVSLIHRYPNAWSRSWLCSRVANGKP